MSAPLLTLIPPVAGGVRDYAQILSHHIPTRILAATEQTPLEDYGPGDVLVNFSGYGYHPRGIPSWLVQRLRELRSRGARIGVYFHELFAIEPPWRSAFWLGPVQRRIAADLGNLADFWLTNCEVGAQWLRAHCAPAPHRVLPVYSNVGEPGPSSHERQDKIVIFGGPANRVGTYRRLDDDFWRWVTEQSLSVHDIGPPTDHPLYQRLCADGRIHAHGGIAAEEVSQHLSEARYTLLCYPTHVLAKSGVFAAYAAHGACSVVLADRYPVHDGLRPNEHYIAGTDVLVRGDAPAPATVGAAARAWYQPHRVEAHAQAFKMLLAGSA